MRADAGTRRRDHVSPSLEWKFNQYLKCARRFQESVTYIDKALVRTERRRHQNLPKEMNFTDFK